MKIFLLRMAYFLPIAIFGAYVLIILIGFVAQTIGAQSVFYTDIFSKLAIAILATILTITCYCQAKSCWHNL